LDHRGNDSVANRDIRSFSARFPQGEHARRPSAKINEGFIAAHRRDNAFDDLAWTERTERALVFIDAGQELFHRLGIDGHDRASGQSTCHTYDSPNGGAREESVNPTARWPERLAHIAALLRAEGAAVLATSGDDLRTVFTHDVSPDTKWRAIFDADAVVRALSGTTIGTAIAAGRWDEQAAFALLTRIDLPDGEALLCALRHGVPFDAVELSTASSAAELLAMSVGDGRAMADAKNESARNNDRVALLEHLLTGLEETRDASALLAQAAEDIAMRMGAGGTSIMLVEGNRLRVRASVGIGVPLGHEQRVDQGIAGWVASRGETVVLHGPVDEDRFRGSDPDAGEAVIMPLRAGDEIIGVLNVKRPTGQEGFGQKLEVLDAIAGDVASALSALKRIDDLEREWRSEVALEDVMRHAAASDADAAARTAASSFGHHAVAVRAPDGRLLALHAEDKECREAALEASAKVDAPPGSGVRVGVARHDRPYEPSEEKLAGRAAEALGLLAHTPMDSTPAKHSGIRVLAVEDHPVMRLGVRALLEREGLVVAGITATCAEAVDLIAENEPDVVLLDLGLPDATGPEAVARIREVSGSLPIIAFSVERSPEVIRAVLRAGANGYVSKDAPSSQVIAALEAAVQGLTALGPVEARALSRTLDAIPAVEASEETTEAEADDSEPGAPVPVREPLTPRELELLRYLAEGYTNKEIARAMVLAEDTVKKGVQTLIAKLGATDRTHAVVLALRRHLIE
jgi:DNA-binding NarL/FixJ family response regulator/putative methionine-R-sulfoxide reductase with GAF domain